MPNKNIIDLDSSNFGGQMYGGFDWGFKILKVYFGQILQKIAFLFPFKISSQLFQIIPNFLPKTIQIRGP
jgi:hypothetical protein